MQYHKLSIYLLLYVTAVPLLAQNVGIGTDSPIEKLHVAGKTLMQDSLRNSLIIRPTDNFKETGLAFQNSGGHYTWSIHRSPGAAVDLIFSGGNNGPQVDSLAER